MSVATARRRAALCALLILSMLPACAPTDSAIRHAAPTAVPWPAFQRGVAYVSFRAGEYREAASDATLAEYVRPLGANWLGLVVTCYQETLTATAIDCDSPRTPTDADLAHAIGVAHRLGMRVMLKPHVDTPDAPVRWRGDIGFGADEASWRAWFASYSALIARYATLARAHAVEYLVVGTELVGTSHRDRDWRAVVAAARVRYPGPLTYAANHGEEAHVQWWDALDAIGVDAYYPLTESDHPTVEQLRAAWRPIVDRLGALSRRWGRPVILTEIGYQSRRGTNRTPWDSGTMPVDLRAQADCYQAVFDAFAGQPWWLGVFWWAIEPGRYQGGAYDGSFTPLNKPAQEILRTNYAGGPPRPVGDTGQPVPPPRPLAPR
ncbi:MAG TPA: hypothetical protein VIL85_09390 [Thermomicrobiales bacterium]